MGEKFLKWAIGYAIASGRWELVVNEAAKFLAHTVKNPQSREAATLTTGVQVLQRACADFLAEVGAQQ